MEDTKKHAPSYNALVQCIVDAQQVLHITATQSDFLDITTNLTACGKLAHELHNVLIQVRYPQHAHPSKTKYVSVGDHFVPGSEIVPIDTVGVFTVTNAGDDGYTLAAISRYMMNDQEREKVREESKKDNPQ